MTGSRITTALLVLEVALTALLLGGTISRGIDLNELGISRPNNLDVNYISENQGLDGSEYEECTGGAYDVFNGNLDESLKSWAKDALSGLLSDLTSSLTSCIGSRIVNGISNRLGFGDAAIKCVKVSASDVKITMWQQLRQKLQSNFIVNCTSSVGRATIADTVTAMLHTQGPDGGPAYITDYNEWLNIRPEKMAQRRMWAILANTNLCAQYADAMMDAMRVPQSYRDNPPPLGADGLAVDGGTPPALQWQCTLPEDYSAGWATDAEYEEMGGIAGIELGLEAQNNPLTLLRMIQAEYRKQVEAAKEVNANMAAGGGGFLPVMSECAEDPEGGDCYRYGTNKQVPGGTQNIVDSSVDAELEALNLATGDKGQLYDIANGIKVRLLDLSNAPMALEVGSGPETNVANYPPAPTATPGPGELPPDDISCTGGNPSCRCPDPEFQQDIRGVLSQVVASTIQIQPGLFVNRTNEIAPGVDHRRVLQAICDVAGGIGICHPHPTQNDMVVFDLGGVQVSVRIITSDGFVRLDGGTAVSMCTDGSM